MAKTDSDNEYEDPFYYDEVDKELYDFANRIIRNKSGNSESTVTVGYLSKEKCEAISAALSDSDYKFSPRVVIDADTIRHIINDHGLNGTTDQSMRDIKDIARMSYVLANFDNVEYFGKKSKRYRKTDNSFAPQVVLSKRINGTYYIIEAVCDGKKNISYVVSAFINKKRV